MARKTASPGADKTPRRRPKARTSEARERELIALAMDQAEQQLRNGTASSQVIVHFLKLGSSRERIEQEMLEKKSENLDAKTDSIRASARIEELYGEAISAMREYNGLSDDGEDIRGLE